MLFVLMVSVVIEQKEENSPKLLRYACIFWLVGSETRIFSDL
jgi:hypothetical protein